MPKKTPLQEIHCFDEVPEFASEGDEAAFWSNHRLGQEILDQMGPLPDSLVPTRERTRPVAVRFDSDILRRLRVLAVKKNKGYQTLLKEFVVERLYEEEKREGIVGVAVTAPPDAALPTSAPTAAGNGADQSQP